MRIPLTVVTVAATVAALVGPAVPPAAGQSSGSDGGGHGQRGSFLVWSRFDDFKTGTARPRRR